MKRIMWQAARDNDKATMTRLLSQATAEDLQYEGEVNKIAYILYVF